MALVIRSALGFLRGWLVTLTWSCAMATLLAYAVVR